MIGFVIGRSFLVVGYVPTTEARAELDVITDRVMDSLLDREEASTILSDSGITADLESGQVTVEIAVRTADEGAARTIAFQQIREALHDVGVSLTATGQVESRQVDLLPA